MNCAKCGTELMLAEGIGYFCPTPDCNEGRPRLTMQEHREIIDRMNGKMYLYTVSVGNPEGTDFSNLYQNPKKFTREEFQDICEDAFVIALERIYEDKGVAHLDDCDEVLDEILKEKGFTPAEVCENYYIEPYWGKDHVKNKKIFELLERPDDEKKLDEWVNRKVEGNAKV